MLLGTHINALVSISFSASTYGLDKRETIDHLFEVL